MNDYDIERDELIAEGNAKRRLNQRYMLDPRDPEYPEEPEPDEDEITEHADALMKGEYNPFIKENIMEAMCELSDDQYEQIAQAYGSTLPSVAGGLIGSFIHDFWQEQASITAREQIEKGE